jgi:hypothetical protein
VDAVLLGRVVQMTSSSQKPTVRLNRFCRDFYNETIFHPIIGGTNVSAVYFDKAREAVIEAGPSFASVDPESFESEIKILRFEVFGEAWVHELGDELMVPQTAFTKRYLEQEGRLDIWRAMEPYNQAIVLSSLWRGADSEVGRASFAFQEGLRKDAIGKWHRQGFSLDVATRASNRLCPEGNWIDGRTPGFLMLALCDRVGCDVNNEEAQFRLTAVIWGLYDGAREAIREVEIKP